MLSKNSSSTAIQGALLATLSALMMSILMAIAKRLPTDIPSVLVVFIRSLFVLLFSLPLLWRNPRRLLRTNQYTMHGLKIIFNACAILCTYYTYRHLPVTLATSLGMTGALFTTVLAVFILKDAVDRVKWLCIVVGYLGALCIIQPGTIQFEVGIITALLANFFAGCGTILAKIISARNVSNFAIIFYNNIGLTLIFGYMSYSHWSLLTKQVALTLSMMGGLSLATHYCYLIALKKASPSFLAPFEYTRLIFAFLIGYTFFQEGWPNLYALLGTVMIVGSTYTITYRDNNRQKEDMRAHQIVDENS